MPINDQGFEVILASSPEYEALTAEIFFDGKFIALISQEHGVDHMMLETAGISLDESQVCRKFDLTEFFQVVERARQRLKGEIK